MLSTALLMGKRPVGAGERNCKEKKAGHFACLYRCKSAVSALDLMGVVGRKTFKCSRSPVTA